MIDFFDKDSLKKYSIMCSRCSVHWQEHDCGPSIVDDIFVYIVEIFYSWKHSHGLDGSILKDHLSLSVFFKQPSDSKSTIVHQLITCS